MNNNERAIWLYGSYARGSADELSDLDILMVSDNPNAEFDYSLPFSVPENKLSVSCYSWGEISGMAEYGSVFLHHLKQEGRPIFESVNVQNKLASILKKLCRYKRATNDIEAFYCVIKDVEESLDCDCSLNYELSVLGTVLRHSCILGCYIAGYQAYGRSKPVELLVDLWGLDKRIAHEFNDLYLFRLSSNRQSGLLPNVNVEYAAIWCQRIRLLLSKLKERVYIYEREMLATN